MKKDFISRSALNGMHLFVSPGEKPDKDTVGWNRAIDYVMNKAPSVDAEPVQHGQWDSFGVRTTDHKGRKRIEYLFNACTACNQGAMTRTSFCPNCGAKMNVEVER